MSSEDTKALQPCPQCGAKASRIFINCDALRTEVVGCSVACGYPRIHPHVRTEWMADAGWTDLADMWNSCSIEKDKDTGNRSLCWSKGPNYKEKAEIAGPFNEWSPRISAEKASARSAIAKATVGKA